MGLRWAHFVPVGSPTRGRRASRTAVNNSSVQNGLKGLVQNPQKARKKRCAGASVRRCVSASVRQCVGASVRRCVGAPVRQCVGVRSSEIGDRSLEIGVWRSEFGDRSSEIGDRRSEFGDRRLEKWQVASGACGGGGLSGRYWRRACRCGEMADARDLKSRGLQQPCGFESRHRHQLRCMTRTTEPYGALTVVATFAGSFVDRHGA